MTAPPDPDEQLFGEAVNLAIRLQTAAGPRAEAAIRDWCARSPDHARIWAEMAEIQGLAGAALRDDHADTGAADASRRRLLGLGLGAVAAAALGAGVGPGLITAARADHRTGTGELRGIRLQDGSQLVLGPDSAIAIDDAAPRGLRLLAGMLTCDIVPGASPFRLDLRDFALTSAGAALSISAERAGVSVMLAQGAATVERQGGRGAVLGAGHWHRFDAGGALLEQAERPAGEAAAWTTGHLSTRSETVAVLVEQIARWLPGRVVLADAAMGRKRVAGTFNLRDPEAALQAVIHPHGGRLRRISPWLRVVSRV